MKKVKAIGIKKAKNRAWEAFSKYIRLRDALKTTGTSTHLICITCGKRYRAFGVGCAQAGHFVSGRNNSILIDERFVHGQCPICNRWNRGEFVKYEMAMIKMYGQEAVDEVKQRSLDTVKISAPEWLDIEEKYKQKYEDLIK